MFSGTTGNQRDGYQLGTDSEVTTVPEISAFWNLLIDDRRRQGSSPG